MVSFQTSGSYNRANWRFLDVACPVRFRRHEKNWFAPIYKGSSISGDVKLRDPSFCDVWPVTSPIRPSGNSPPLCLRNDLIVRGVLRRMQSGVFQTPHDSMMHGGTSCLCISQGAIYSLRKNWGRLGSYPFAQTQVSPAQTSNSAAVNISCSPADIGRDSGLCMYSIIRSI